MQLFLKFLWCCACFICLSSRAQSYGSGSDTNFTTRTVAIGQGGNENGIVRNLNNGAGPHSIENGVISSENSTEPSKASGRVFFKTDPVDGSQSIIGTWFTFTSWTLTFAFFGTVFLLACSATAVYYVLFVVTEPSQQHRRSVASTTISNSITSKLENWNFVQVLDLIHIGYDLYFTLDLDNLECQKKILCEFQEPESNQIGGSGDISRKVSEFLLYLDVFRNYPHIKQYQEAVIKGQTRRKDLSCDQIYPECQFSVDNFDSRFRRVFPSENSKK